MECKLYKSACMLTLSLLFLLAAPGCGGCAESGAPDGLPEPLPSPSEGANAAPPEERFLMQDTPVRDVETELSPEAGETLAYLLHTQAVLHEDEALLLEAVPLLAACRAPAKIWLEGGVWLMGRRSSNAVALLEQGMKIWPEDLSLNLLYAEALMEQGQTERGIALMRDYLQKYPDALDARLELALLLVKNDQFSEADELLNSVPLNKRSPLVEYYHARALIGMQRQDEAIPHLRKSLKEMPDFTEALAELAFLYEQQGKFRDARSTYEKLLKLNFSSQEVIFKLINLSLRLREPEKALRYMRQGPNETSFKMTVAGMFMESRHYLQAERLLKQIAAEGNAPDDVYLFLADVVYEQRRDLPLALSWLDKMPANTASAYRARAVLLRAQLTADAGQEEKAIAIARQGRHDFADISDFWKLEAIILARQKNMPDALKIAREAVEKWPRNTELAFLLGSLLDENGDKKAAFSVMEKILDLQPDNFQALNYVGYTLAEENRDLERALKLLSKADELSPNQSYIVDSLAWALFKIGRLDEALKEIRRAVKLDDKSDPTIWEHYGEIAQRMGLKDEARRAYQKALEFKPANAEILRRRLSQL